MSNEYSEDNLVEAAAQQALDDLGWMGQTNNAAKIEKTRGRKRTPKR